MSHYIHPRIDAACIFFTLALAQRGSDLLLREVERLRQAVADTKRALPFEINAWVVLPDHLHAIWPLPAGDSDYPLRWRLIKSRFSHGLMAQPRSPSKAQRAEKGIWQRRYWDHHIRNAADYATHVRYCWGNPVKHGLVSRASDWPFSSLHRDMRFGLVEPEWAEVAGEFGE